LLSKAQLCVGQEIQCLLGAPERVAYSYKLDGLDWIKLAPKKGGSDFSSVTIGFKGAAPQQLELVDGLNQVTRIELENLVVNPDVADGTFEFKPPAGVDVIGGEG